MDEKTVVVEHARAVISSITICSHCKSNPANLSLTTYRPYCDECWKNMNEKKSRSMLAKNMKRSASTRAAMSASKKVKRKEDPKTWKLYYDFFKEQLEKQEQLNLTIAIDQGNRKS